MCSFARRANRARGSSPRRGLSVIYLGVMLLALVGFVSLAVDIGRIRLARTELQLAADASARSGALSLPISQKAVIEKAYDAAYANPSIDADDRNGGRTNPGVELDPGDDIHVGLWDAKKRTFTELFDDGSTTRDERREANAVRTIARRIKKRDNPVPLIFAPVIGIFSSDIETPAIAYIGGGAHNFGFVGINAVKSNGNYASIDSSVTGKNAVGGGVASNGNIDLGNGDVYGDVRPGIGMAILQNPNSIATGWTANLDYTLSYPVIDSIPSPPPLVTSKGITPPSVVDLTTGTVTCSNQNVNVKSGTYYFKGWVDKGGGNTTITGPATIYIDGDFVMSGDKNTMTIKSSAGPVKFIVNGNFTQNTGVIVSNSVGGLYISVIKKNTSVTLSGDGQQTAAHVYAPLSDVTINGTPGFTGWIIGKTLTFLGISKLHYDETGKDKTPYRIALVK